MFSDKTTDKTDSIQDIAIKLLAEQQFIENPEKRTIFVLGSQGVGKTTAISHFVDKEQTPSTRPTLALEYSYSKRTSPSQDVQMQIVNIWELGSLENSEHLIGVPLRSHGPQHFAVVLFVDLSQPNRMWADLESAYNGLRSVYIKQLNESELTAHREKSSERVGKEHPDLPTMDIFPFPLIIVGGKYDIFMDFDPEVKKHVCRCLRCIAHAIGASVLFYSTQIPRLLKTLRDTISHLGYGSPLQPFRSFSVDYNGPLSVWFGSDTWEQIGVNPLPIDRIGLAFCQDVPQLKTNKSNLPDDPTKDPGFHESIIDEMRAQKNEELITLIKENEMRGKFKNVNE